MSLDQCYFHIAKRAEKLIGTPSETTSPDKEFELQIRTLGSRINYQKYGTLFNQRFWLKNYWKAVYFFEYEHPDKSFPRDESGSVHLKIASLGSGAGSDIAACIAWLSCRLPARSPVVFELVDRSAAQLSMAKNILEDIVQLFPGMHCEFVYKIQDVRQWHPTQRPTDFVLLSHLLTEQQDDIPSLLSHITEMTAPRGEIIILERERDPVWRQAVEVFSNNALAVYDATAHETKRKMLGGAAPHIVRAMLPTHTYQRDLVVTYFRAWKEQSIELLKNIFDSDAMYDEKPGIESPLEGLCEIVDYWKEFPLQQKNINLHIRSIAHQDHFSVCSFEGDFDTPRQHIAIRGAMNFYFDPYTKKIRKFSEYFGTQKTPFTSLL